MNYQYNLKFGGIINGYLHFIIECTGAEENTCS